MTSPGDLLGTGSAFSKSFYVRRHRGSQSVAQMGFQSQQHRGVTSFRLIVAMIATSVIAGMTVWLAEVRLRRNLKNEVSSVDLPAHEQKVVAPLEINFVDHIEPIFKGKCYKCHGPVLQEADLNFADAGWKTRKLHGQSLVQPGNSMASRLLSIVSGDDPDVVMPPEGPLLTQNEIQVLRDWIRQGATIPISESDAPSQHWSLRKLVRPAVPAIGVAEEDVSSPIDAFVRARLQESVLSASERADSLTRLRRLSFDLTGLPPTVEEVEIFLADKNPNAWQRAIDRYLASPNYGEKWARHWLDQVRYADSDGFEIDPERPHAWRYRNWVIDAFNSDMTFDEFSTRQLAGDLLSGATTDNHIATGMYRCAPLNREAGTKLEQNRYEQTVNRVNAIGTVWLGMSVGCAQCHDHKYDAISQEEYFGLFGIIHSTENVLIDVPQRSAGPIETALSATDSGESGTESYDLALTELLGKHDFEDKQFALEMEMRKVAHNPEKYYPSRPSKLYTLITAYVDNANRVLFTPPDKRTRAERDAFVDFFQANEIRVEGLEEALQRLRFDFAPGFAATIRQAAEPSAARLYVRGDFFQPGPEVSRTTPAALHEGSPEEMNRLALAKWIVDPANPLTPRVIVNRVWQQFFGSGLVRTVDEFGVQGERPSHPELLDWLASEFVGSGWSLKHLHRLIVTSETYQQSSVTSDLMRELDPNNRLLSRQSRHRLSAEQIRDAALQASGLLYPVIGGPSIKPAQPAGVAELSEGGDERWTETTDARRFKRGLYIHFQRTTPYPFLLTFDAPDATDAACEREVSTTPLQALNLLNDPVFIEAAKGLGQIIAAHDGSEHEKISYAVSRCLARRSVSDELKRLTEFRQQLLAELRSNPDSVASLLSAEASATTRESTVESDTRSVDVAAWILFARMLMNLDEFQNRE